MGQKEYGMNRTQETFPLAGEMEFVHMKSLNKDLRQNKMSQQMLE